MAVFKWESYRLNIDEEKTLYSLINSSWDTLEKQFIKTKNNLIEMIELTKRVIEDAENKNWMDIKEIWNTIGNILYISYDFKLIIEQLCKKTEKDIETLFLRFACIHLYESSKNITDLLGSNFSKEVVKIGVSNEIISELSEIRKKLHGFFEEHKDDFGLIRNTISAHRDKQFLTFYDIFTSLENIPIMRIVFEFDNLLNEAGIVVGAIMRDSTYLKTKGEHYYK